MPIQADKMGPLTRTYTRYVAGILHQQTWAPAILAICVSFPFLPFILGTRTFFLVDLLYEQYSYQAIINNILAAAPHQVPTWNPYSLCGVPLLADPEMQAYYPPSVLYRLLALPAANGIYDWLHISLSLVGMWVFLREVGLNKGPAALGALAFALNTHVFMVAVNGRVIAAHSANGTRY